MCRSPIAIGAAIGEPGWILGKDKQVKIYSIYGPAVYSWDAVLKAALFFGFRLLEHRLIHPDPIFHGHFAHQLTKQFKRDLFGL